MSEQADKSYNKMQTQTDQIRYEFTNQDTVVLRKNGMFWKAMGNSAVMLKSIGIETKIRSGFDPVTKQEILELSIHVGHIAEIKTRLRVNSSELLRDDENFFIVRLKQSMGARKIKALNASSESKQCSNPRGVRV